MKFIQLSLYESFFSLGIKAAGNMLDEIVDGGEALAVLLADLEIEFLFDHKVDLTHVESVEADLLKALVEMDLRWVPHVIMESNASDDSLCGSNRISHVTITILSLHDNIVLIVAPLYLWHEHLWLNHLVLLQWSRGDGSPSEYSSQHFY